MNKVVLSVLAGVIIIAGGVTYVIVTKSDDNSTSKTDTPPTTQSIKSGSNAYVAVDACDVLTASAAQQILGAGATKGDTSAGNVSSDDLSVSNCVYTVRTGATPSSANSVGLLARAAKSSTGAASNQAQFGSAKPAGAQDVSGIGDKAYYSPAYKQLNVLKGNNWYIVTNSVGSVTNATLESDTQLAKLLQFK
jgi:hypothetical protein